MSHHTSELHERVVFDLQMIVRAGLPLRMLPPDSAVLGLRGVVGRAAIKDDPASLVAALEGVMRLQLAHLPDAKSKEAGALLFGNTHESSNRTLTERREQAAVVSGYEVHHFRKRVEPRILAAVASALITDSETYSRNRAMAPPLMLQTKRPELLPQEVLAWEAVEHEEKLLRIWAAVYGLRAELLTLERLISMDSPADELAKIADRILWQSAVLVGLGADYQAAYGDRVMQSDSEISPQELLRLAGWTPSLTAPEKRMLASIAREKNELEFISSLQSEMEGRSLQHRWRRELGQRLVVN